MGTKNKIAKLKGRSFCNVRTHIPIEHLLGLSATLVQSFKVLGQKTFELEHGNKKKKKKKLQSSKGDYPITHHSSQEN